MRTRRCTGCRHVYSPGAIASVLAAGMGAAGVASGSTIARTADGRQVSALAEAVTGTRYWGRREQRRYLNLSRVLVLVTSNAAIVREWTLSKRMGRELTRWPASTSPLQDPKRRAGRRSGGSHARADRLRLASGVVRCPLGQPARHELIGVVVVGLVQVATFRGRRRCVLPQR